MLQIQAVTVFEVNGKQYKSLAKAEDSIQEQIVDRLRKEFVKDNGLRLTDFLKIADFLISNRLEFAYLLGYELPDLDSE